MLIAVSKQSALRALRVFRSARRQLPHRRHELPEPDPAPQSRWTVGIVPLDALGLSAPPDKSSPIDVIVPTAASRLRASFFSCHVQPAALPKDSFVMLGDELCIPCPELLFLQMADVMTPEVHALLGYELCGSFSRSATDPRIGDVTYDIAPVTSVEKISRYLDACGRRRGAVIARNNLRRVADSAWAPLEAVIALMARLPAHAGGYELGEVSLNVRHGTTPELVALGCRESRVPDIEIAGTHVGFNYDGRVHLGLDVIVEAAQKGNLAAAIRDVREKYLDDLKRNRELAAMGRVILPVTSSDLFAPGGLDVVMLEAALAMEEFDGRSASHLRTLLGRPSAGSRRQQLIWSLLPWPEAQRYARELLERTPWKVASHEGRT